MKLYTLKFCYALIQCLSTCVARRNFSYSAKFCIQTRPSTLRNSTQIVVTAVRHCSVLFRHDIALYFCFILSTDASSLHSPLCLLHTRLPLRFLRKANLNLDFLFICHSYNLALVSRKLESFTNCNGNYNLYSSEF
jgi:hypothetical protein